MQFELDKFIEIKTLISALFGASLVWSSDYFKSILLKRKNKHYLAVRVTPILENFLDLCYDVAFDDGTSMGMPAGEGGYYYPQAQVPDLNLPNDVDWTSINKELLQEILFLSRELERIKRLLDGELEYSASPPYDEFMYFRRRKFSEFSVKCDDILIKLKEILSLPTVKCDESWNPREKCLEFLAK